MTATKVLDSGADESSNTGPQMKGKMTNSMSN